MFIIKETKIFSKWLLKLKDIERAKQLAKEYQDE